LAASCGTNGPTIRVVNALSNTGSPYIPLDVYVNLAKINSTSLGFGGVIRISRLQAGAVCGRDVRQRSDRSV